MVKPPTLQLIKSTASKTAFALEVEWNNKDPFYDRDLNSFRLLFELRVIAAGVIITRADALQELFDQLK